MNVVVLSFPLHIQHKAISSQNLICDFNRCYRALRIMASISCEALQLQISGYKY